MPTLENAHALVIGIANYQHVNKLPPTVLNDARDIRDLLVAPGHCGYPEDNVELLLDGQATQPAMGQALHELAARSEGESTVFIYISGHGARIESGPHAGEYLLPVDALSWRVLHTILHDRTHRSDYADSFLKLWKWAQMKREEEAREEPFAKLVLAQTKTPETEENLARVHRLIRWWKLKTKFNRSLSDDEPKALRMIVKAYKRGDDYEGDPERGLPVAGRE